jgi:cell division protein FtsA
VTNDIAHAFQTTNSQAEQLKTNEASAIIGGAGLEQQRVKVPGSSPLIETRTISRRALDTVVNARLRELFTVIRETLEDLDLLNRLHAGVVLTGGGAAMRDLDALVSRELGMGARIGRPIHVDGLENEKFPAAFAAISGALLFASRNYEEKGVIDSLLKRFFK